MSVRFANKGLYGGSSDCYSGVKIKEIRIQGTNKVVPLLHSYVTYYSLITVIKGFL